MDRNACANRQICRTPATANQGIGVAKFNAPQFDFEPEEIEFFFGYFIEYFFQFR